MSEKTLQEVTRESSLGYHMINTFQNCPRKWYIKYICGILPTKLGKALLFGKAWHEGMEVFYRGADAPDKKVLADKAYEHILQTLNENKAQFKNEEELAETLARTPVLFRKWYEEIGCKLHDEYAIIAVEEEERPQLGGKFTMTIRPDAIAKERSTGAIYIPEHKTTAYSILSQLETVTRADQATAYCWGVLKNHPEYALNFGGVLLDVCYNRFNAKNRTNSEPDVKQQVICRNKASLVEFELNLLGIFLDLSNRIRGWETHPELCALLFPRNGGACSAFGCEYESICRNRITPDMVLGSEFFIDQWKGREQLLADTEGEHLGFKSFSDADNLARITVDH